MEDEPGKIGLVVGYTRDDKVHRYIRRDPLSNDEGKRWSTPDWSRFYDWSDIYADDMTVFGTL